MVSQRDLCKTFLMIPQIARSLLTLLAAVLATAVALPATATAQTDGVLPVCSTGFSQADWFSGTIEDRMANVIGEKDFIESMYVGRGTLSECASQMSATFGPNSTFLGFEKPLITVSESVIDAAAGDAQTVTISVPQATSVFWPSCYPYQGGGSVTCPDAAPANGNAGFGKILVRPRASTGFFDSLWTAIWLNTTPGFQLQQVGPLCSYASTSCTYTVRFARDLTNLPLVLGDKQVLLQLPYFMSSPNRDITAAIPLLMIVSGGGAQPGPNQTPSTGPPTGGSTTSPVQMCVVPKLTGRTLTRAKKLLKAAYCRVGDVTRRKSKRVAKGRVISTSLKAGAKRDAGTKVKLVISRGA